MDAWHLIEQNKIDIYKSSSVVDTTDDSVTVKTPEGREAIACDILLTSVGYVKNDSLYNAVKDMQTPVYNLGDSAEVKNIMYAIWNSYELGRSI